MKKLCGEAYRAPVRAYTSLAISIVFKCSDFENIVCRILNMFKVQETKVSLQLVCLAFLNYTLAKNTWKHQLY